MKQILLIINFLLLLLTSFFIYKYIKIQSEQNKTNLNLQSDIAILDSLIQCRYNYIDMSDLNNHYYNADSIYIIGNRIVNNCYKSSTSLKSNSDFSKFYNLCSIYINEPFFAGKDFYSPISIKIMQLWSLESFYNFTIPIYRFDAYTILPINSEIKQSSGKQNLKLWVNYRRIEDIASNTDFIKIIFKGDTIQTSDDYFYHLPYTPLQKGSHYIPVKLIFKNRTTPIDYKIHVVVK